ncbi:hypothetical protein QQZ08_010657 [Neonectria magnoliae]|uniref:Aminoglycoside phosphotransferase domain-containing protein n=1 Tax=Neonectria magnoliae TaxID=2732573 RepID=A0ABR1HG51_9HYPO
MASNPEPGDYHGLKWARGLWGSETRWTVDPDEAAIKRTFQSTLQLSDSCEISFLGQGAFKKLYVVKDSDKEVVARVTLPVDPAYKTLSEVATISWVRRNTSLPVPEILAYDATRRNTVGFGWIAMTRIPGKPLADVWRAIDFAAKKQLVHQLARFSSDTFCNQLHAVGSIFPVHEVTVIRSSSPVSESGKTILRCQQSTGFLSATTKKVQNSPQPRRITSTDFIWDGRIHRDIPRGPFESSRDWLSARLTIAEMLCQERLAKARQSTNDKAHKSHVAFETEGATEGDIELARETANEHNGKEQPDEKDEEEEEEVEDDDDEYDVEELESTMDIISRLRNRLDEFFPTLGPGPEPSMIIHDDMSRHNILVHDGALSGVVDWECIAALPLWAACQYPSFLHGQDRHDEPTKSKYQHDNAAKLYWEHLDDFELTQLRQVFLEEMRKLQPRWVDIFESSQRQRDFDLAVSSCDDGFMIRRIQRWLDDMDSGLASFQGLEERIDNATL